ncbi:MAG: 2-oxo acid dehydrogenase subunit E2 [Deltaproteobacteria bacterium]|nr:2-oxo acid dehydrogenase subunit E2 [Deltaproteobacteria bacterium]
MASVIEMPKLSDTMEEGGIAEWFRKEGDYVEEGEPLLAIETDKATMEYSSPEEGVLLKILVPAGTTVRLQQAIAVIGAKGEQPDYDSLLKAPAASAATSATKEEQPSPGRAAPETTSRTVTGPAAEGRIKASPLARKLAQEKGLSLNQLQGSGPHGRIIQRDVTGAAVTPAFRSGGSADKRIPHSMMRKTIAKRLLAAKNEAPHFYLSISADMSAVLDWRTQLNRDPGVEKGELPKVSVNDLLILAAGRALRRHPEINASWEEDAIIQFGQVDVCMAVALPSGLVTPVIRGADQLSAREIAARSRLLAGKARDGSLSPEEYTGGSFTISNLGMTRVESFTAIINPPQACILAAGASLPQPWVDESGQLLVRPRMQMTLSCDHRVVDGMTGARFLETLVSFLEQPLLMI